MKFVYNIERQYPLASPSIYTTLSSIFFALNSFSVKYFDGIPATQIIYWRSILTLIVIELLALFIPNNTYPSSNKTLKKLIIRGCIGGVGFLSCFISLKLVTVSEAVVLMKTNPLWTTFVLAYILKKEAITKRTILEILFCLLGVVLISKPPILFN